MEVDDVNNLGCTVLLEEDEISEVFSTYFEVNDDNVSSADDESMIGSDDDNDTIITAPNDSDGDDDAILWVCTRRCTTVPRMLSVLVF